MEQAERGEERSSISDPLDPVDVTLIWSAGNFLDPSLTVKMLETNIKKFRKVWFKERILCGQKSIYRIL